MRLDARRYDATASDTSEAFIDTTMSSKPSFSRMRTGTSAASTMPAGSCTPYFAITSLGSDPALAPTRIGMPRSLASVRISMESENVLVSAPGMASLTGSPLGGSRGGRHGRACAGLDRELRGELARHRAEFLRLGRVRRRDDDRRAGVARGAHARVDR